METIRLFYENVYQKEFEAEVLFSGKEDGRDFVLLDRTAFYPEGGGQPSDKGTLLAVDAPEGRKKQVKVLDAQYREDGIRHYIDGSLDAGSRVKGTIDWDRRFDLMQQHSGEHLVSGFIHEMYGYHNVGFHMGEDLVTVDVSGALDKEQLAEVERKVNGYIWTNQRARIFYPDEKERERLPYRSKKELTGEVRLVEFPGGDLCACCGLHVENTGEIGIVKLLSVKHFREGARIEMAAGKRAFDLLNEHFNANSRVAVELSAKPGETPAAVARLQEENYQWKGKVLRLQNERIAMRAGECRGKKDVVIFERELNASDIRKETDRILDSCQGICVVLSQKEDNSGCQYAVGQREGDVRAFVQEMNRRLRGKGGGKPFFAQGFFEAGKKEAERFFREKGFTIL